MGNMLLGRYIQGDSFIHRLDPRTKLISCFYFVAIVFLASNFYAYGILTAYVLTGVFLSGISVSFYFKGLKTMIGMILFTVVFQLFFVSGGQEYFRWGFIAVTEQGVLLAIFMFLRFLLIIFMSTLMTVTTNPLALTDGLEHLFSPLKWFKVPVHELALMLSIALRFIPTLSDEAQKIMNAQRARGVVFDEGNFVKRVKAMVPILIPLFVSSFMRAEELANAMEARGYRGGEGRTKYRQLTWRLADTLVCISLIVLTAALLLARQL